MLSKELSLNATDLSSVMVDKAVQVNMNFDGVLEAFPRCDKILVESVTVPVHMYSCHVVLYRGILSGHSGTNKSLRSPDEHFDANLVKSFNPTTVVPQDAISTLNRGKVCHESQGPETMAMSDVMASKCTSCDVVFDALGPDNCKNVQETGLHNLMKHQMTCNSLYVCAYCVKMFSESIKLTRHVERVHNDKLPFACNDCGQSLASGNFAVHAKTCQMKPSMKCKLCDKIFLIRHRFREHVRLDHADRVRNDPRRLSCRLCGIKFNEPTKLKRHFVVEHPGENPYKCTDCAENFIVASDLTKHMACHGGLQRERRHRCTQCTKSFKSVSNFRNHVRQVHTKIRTKLCQYCSKAFFSSRDMRRHEDFCKGTKLVSCSICDRKFSTEYSLKAHLSKHVCDEANVADGLKNNSAFSDLRTYSCPQCDLIFPTRVGMSRHLSRVHNRALDFVCTYCSKRFSSRQDLKRHTVVHTGEKPYACKVCDKRFTQGTSLRDHMLLHTGERPYVCAQCGKTFTQSSSLRTHAAVHRREKV